MRSDLTWTQPETHMPKDHLTKSFRFKPVAFITNVINSCVLSATQTKIISSYASKSYIQKLNLTSTSYNKKHQYRKLIKKIILHRFWSSCITTWVWTDWKKQRTKQKTYLTWGLYYCEVNWTYAGYLSLIWIQLHQHWQSEEAGTWSWLSVP